MWGSVIISLVVFSLVLFLISFRFKKYNPEAEIEELSFRQAAELYNIKRRLKVLEQELMAEMEE